MLRRLRKSPQDIPAKTIEEIKRFSRQHQFFHWHLAFPEVFVRGGFDRLLGNPPWEMMELSEKEYFVEGIKPVMPEQAAETLAYEGPPCRVVSLAGPQGIAYRRAHRDSSPQAIQVRQLTDEKGS